MINSYQIESIFITGNFYTPPRNINNDTCNKTIVSFIAKANNICNNKCNKTNKKANRPYPSILSWKVIVRSVSQLQTNKKLQRFKILQYKVLQ